jgi:oligoendopeptidase F
MKHLSFITIPIKILTTLTILLLFMSQSAYSQMDRSQIDEKYTWNLTDLYENDAAWRSAMEKQFPKADDLLAYKGKLGKSAQNLFDFLEKNLAFNKDLQRLFVYASLQSDQNTADTKNQGMVQELRQKASAVSAKLSFVSPELSAIPKETLAAFRKDLPELSKYDMFFDNLERQKKYILSEKEERIVAEAGKLTQAPYSIYGTFSNAEFPFPSITLSDGTEVYLDKSAYGKYRTLENREDREAVFQAFWKEFHNFKNTFAQQLYANVNNDVFRKNVRGFESCLQASLSDNNIPVEVYHALIDNVNKHLPTFHRYLEIKKRLLGVDTLKYSDTYVSGVKGIKLDYSWEEARDLVIDAVSPLGKQYQSDLSRSFSERWIDVYPNKGKRSGAYSNGSAYDVHPYVLMNYNDQYDDVSTLAHELGHAMHSFYSNKNQPFVDADYSIFVAEVASTVNERLLNKLILEQTENYNAKLSLLMNILDGFRTTLFRQTQFAEFELKIHEHVEAGMPLTSDVLNEIYKDILYRYYGHEENVCYIEDLYEIEWAYIPHFYYNFYVYQYATSFSASVALSQDILAGKEGAVDKYLNFISSGSSKYPIDLLRETGVDMTTGYAIEKTMEAMNELMDEVEEMLDKR